MLPHQLEAWVLEIVDHVTQGRDYEDFRVEMKRQFPEPEKSARRLAGHANAARGASVLWIVGLDSHQGVVGVDEADLESWWPQVKSSFDGLAPAMFDKRVPTGGEALTALHFETADAPYVVKNPIFGTAVGGPVELEVPWRDGTRTRSARREDLIRLLAPVRRRPEFEILDLELRAANSKEAPDEWQWFVSGRLYMTRQLDSVAVIPEHLTSATVAVLDDRDTVLRLEELTLEPKYRQPTASPFSFIPARETSNRPVVVARETAAGQVELTGPIQIGVSGRTGAVSAAEFPVAPPQFECRLELPVLEIEPPVTIDAIVGSRAVRRFGAGRRDVTWSAVRS